MLPSRDCIPAPRYSFSLGFALCLAFVSSALQAAPAIPLEWEETNSSTVSSYERSSRYAYPLKINHQKFQRARNVELPNHGTIYVTLPFGPYIDQDIRQSTVVDVFGSVIGFRKIADPSQSNNKQITELFAYDDSAAASERWKKGLSRSAKADPSPNIFGPPAPQQPADSRGPYPNTPVNVRGNAPSSSNRPVEIGIDLDKGEWFFVPEKSGQRFKLAPTAKEKSIRIYEGARPRILPKSIIISDTPSILSGTSNSQRIRTAN